MMVSYLESWNMQCQPALQCPPPHRVAILMSAAGRFLVCRNCQLRLKEFPAGTRYDTIAKEFESHACSSPIQSKDDAA
jgi:hypothetical protein